MKTRAALTLFLLGIFLAACGDDDGFLFPTEQSNDTIDYSTAVTGTVPLPGPVSWIEWTPAESITPTAEAELIAGLQEFGARLILPTEPPPDGQPHSAMVESMALGYGNGATFPGTTEIWINIDNIVIVNALGGTVSCGGGEERITFRADPEACLIDDDGSPTISWQEEGHWLQVRFRGVSLEDGRAWLETWRMVP